MCLCVSACLSLSFSLYILHISLEFVTTFPLTFSHRQRGKQSNLKTERNPSSWVGTTIPLSFTHELPPSSFPSGVSLLLFIFFNTYIHILAMMQKQNQIEMYLYTKLCFSKFVDVFKLKWNFAFRFHCFVFIMIGFHSIVCIYFKVLFVFLVMLFTWWWLVSHIRPCIVLQPLVFHLI